MDFSNNEFSGSIDSFFCFGVNKSRTASILNLENNSLSGELPNCGWENWRDLEVLNLGINQFSGELPIFIGNLTNLTSLVLRMNNLSGIIPIDSLINSTSLEILDASENQFEGDVLLQVAQGSLPIQICLLSSLHILDVSDNHLFGVIPRCIHNLSSMVSVDHSDRIDISHIDVLASERGWSLLQEHVFLVGKEMIYDYSSNLNLVRVIDLSRNKFSGVIPKEVTSLRALRTLNLSHNLFTGTIGAMVDIENLDFSANLLSGKLDIPELSEFILRERFL